MTTRTALFSILSASALVGTAGALGADSPAAPDLATLTKMTARFEPVDIGADISTLPASERDEFSRTRGTLMALLDRETATRLAARP